MNKVTNAKQKARITNMPSKTDINPATGNCKWCKNYFSVPRNHRSRGQKYCSVHCYYKAKVGSSMKNKGRPLSQEHRKKLSGSNASNWKGGITKKNELMRKRVDFRIWRIAVFTRDNYTCKICNKKGGELNADHIKPFSLYPELRYAIDNGRTLCIDCHMKTNTWGGRIFKYA